jgi:hypothetical protein
MHCDFLSHTVEELQPAKKGADRAAPIKRTPYVRSEEARATKNRNPTKAAYVADGYGRLPYSTDSKQTPSL